MVVQSKRNHSLTSLELLKNCVGDGGRLEGHRCLLNLELGNNFIQAGSRWRRLLCRVW